MRSTSRRKGTSLLFACLADDFSSERCNRCSLRNSSIHRLDVLTVIDNRGRRNTDVSAGPYNQHNRLPFYLVTSWVHLLAEDDACPQGRPALTFLRFSTSFAGFF